ncbi:MAG: response regulator, partial [Treponema sp.]|nr:response regulator [Treponema sp.]
PLGDPGLLRDALLSLLANAVKYTNTGMVKLHSAIKDTNDKTVTISFEVKDSGIGVMSGQEREAQDLVRMMGGKLLVECVPRVGCRCSFDLTFDTIHVVGGDDGKDAVIDEFEMPMFDGEVLLCEDNDMNQQIVCEHLTRVGLKTVVAENGKIGVDAVQDRVNKKEKLFDLILMDIHMPVMDGLEAAAKITELNTGVPIMALTANIMSNDLEIYRMSGMYDFVGKPFTSQQLWRALSKFLIPVNRQTTKQNTSAESHQIWVENKLRRKIISHFVKNHHNTLAEIRDAIREGDIKLANRLAHTLKGNAGQAGKILLQQAATVVEQHLKDGQDRVTQREMATLEVELNAALAELTPLANEFSMTERT